MKTRLLFTLILALTGFLNVSAQLINVNPDPNGDLWLVGGDIPMTAEELSKIPQMVPTAAALSNTLPSSCDNSQFKYMAPVVLQKGQSCRQFAEVWYSFGYEMNFLKKTDAGDTIGKSCGINQYSPYFTYNFLNQGDGSSPTGAYSGFNILKQIGIPNSTEYGNIYGHDSLFKYWMTGYDKYSNGSKNRVVKIESFQWQENDHDDYFLDSLTNLKIWLANHNTEYDTGGLAVISTYISPVVYNVFPPGTPHANERYFPSWGSINEGHALTLVGYDDSVCCYDLNGDQIYQNIDVDGDGLELSECEKGAFKAVNSWGTTFGNGGYIWIPYKLFGNVSKAPHSALKCDVDTIKPEMSVRFELTHPKRNTLCYYAGKSTTSCQMYPSDSVVYNAAYLRGGPNHMRGIFPGPIEFEWGYSTLLDIQELGKVFLRVVEYHDNWITDGYIHYFSLIDRRWGEEFELPMTITDPILLTNNDTTRLAINYFLLPHHNEHITNEYRVTCDRVSRFTTEVKSGGVLRIMSGSQYDRLNVDMYNSTIHVNEGGSLVLGGYNTITAKRGNCRIIIDGSLSLDSGLNCKAEEGATLELIIRRGAIVNNDTIKGINLDNAKIMNYSDNIIISGFQAFNNSTIQSYGGNVTIMNGGCEESNIRLENFLSDQSAKATVKNVGFGGNNNSSVQALFVYNYGKYEISDNIIADYNKGIQLMLCGNGTSGNQIINNNQIYGHTSAGVLAYNTTGKFSGLNKIYDNGTGLQFFNKCLLSIEGYSLATDISQTQQIYDNASYELYATQLGFPTYCRYNYISDYNNGGNPNDPIVYYDNNVQGSYQLVDVSHNCWGTGFNASQDLKINNGYIQFIPFWCPGGGGGNPTSNLAEQLYNTALAYADSGMCVIASSYYKEVIDQYPQSEYAIPAMKQLYHIEQCAGGLYDSLSNYFLGNGSIINDSSLAFLGRYLSNECKIAQQDWPAAIAWYENQILHPYSPEDSLFALIDLEHLYIIMENSGLKQAVVGKMANLKPKNSEQFFQDADYYLSLLPFKKDEDKNQNPKLTEMCKLEQNTPNPFNSTTTIKYSLSQSAIVKLVITDMTGRVLYDKMEGNKDKGNYTVILNNLKLESGNYLYSIYLNDKLFDTKKMTIIK